MSDLDNEVWKTIDEYPDYEVSSEGRVRRKFKNKILKPCKNAIGYYYVNLCDGENKITKSVHRLVAKAFIPNEDNFSDVDHQNRDKADNRVENLRWLSHTDNLKKRDMHWESSKRLVKVAQYTKEGELVATYNSITEASKEIGIHVTAISNCLTLPESHHSAGGFIWRRVSRED